MGAYLILFSFVLAISLVFSFVCLPLGVDKRRLRKSLFCWLAVDLVCIVVVAVIMTVLVTIIVIIALIANSHEHHADVTL